MNRSLSIVSVIASVTALATAPDARADNTPTASRAPGLSDTERENVAQKRYTEGLRFFDLAVAKNRNRGLFEQAYVEFKAAVEARPNGKRYWNLAVSEVETERWLAAVDDLRRADELEHVSRADHRFHQRYVDYLAKADRALGHFEVTAQAGVAVLIDEKPVGLAPLSEPVRVEPGEHVVTIDGHAFHRMATAGETEKINATVAATTPAVPALAPVEPKEPEVRRAEGPPEPYVPHEETGSHTTQIVVASSFAAAAVAAAIAGALFENAAESNKTKASGQTSRYLTPSETCVPGSSPLCTQIAGYHSAYKTDVVLGPVMYGSAAVLGALGIASAFYFAPRKHETAAVVVPVISPTKIGLALEARF